MRNSVVKVPFQVAWHDWDTAENDFHRADIKCWELGGPAARSYSMGIPFLCMQLFGVREIGSNVLKNTSKTSI